MIYSSNRTKLKNPNASGDSITLQEAKGLLGYNGTKKIEKKYNMLDPYCITRTDVMMAKVKDNVVKKAEKAVTKIKDPEDMKAYFDPLLKDLFFNMMISKPSDLNKFPNVKKVNDLYTKNCKDRTSLNKLCTSSAARIAGVSAALMASYTDDSTDSSVVIESATGSHKGIKLNQLHEYADNINEYIGMITGAFEISEDAIVETSDSDDDSKSDSDNSSDKFEPNKFEPDKFEPDKFEPNKF